MVDITENEIKVDEILREAIDKNCGAVASFTGVVRKENKGKDVKEIFYESYDRMALNALKSIENEAIDRFGVKNINIVHRKGRLKPGEVSLFISVSSKHRQEAFLACWFIIEEIKRRLPVWKKEIFEDGEEWIEG